jgi:superfamily II DNA or RNA helicase
MSLFRKNGDAIKLRPYQDQAVQDLRLAIAGGSRQVILQAGTGSGKTVVASEIIKKAVAKGKQVLFLAHRRELIDQCGLRLDENGVGHGIIMAGRRGTMGEPVQVASIMTLWARAFKRQRIKLPEADLIVMDECHHGLSATYKKLVAAYPEAVLLGLTATPCRGDGRGLGEMYQGMVHCPSIGDLTRDGFLVPVRYFAAKEPDVSKVKVRMGDYVESELERAMDKSELVGDVVENWGRLGEDRQTVVFASGVKHSIHLADEFRKAGVEARHLDANTPLDERADILADLASGKARVVCNCMVLTEGWDCPPVSCIVLARPTKSLGLYIQMGGRALRPHPGKKDCLLLDHAGACREHGFLDEDIPWTLDGKTRISEEAKKVRKRNPVKCPKCKRLFKGMSSCPGCGWEPKAQGQDVDWSPGNLAEVGKRGNGYSASDKARWIKELRGLGMERGYKAGWAAHVYRAKFGSWPPRVTFGGIGDSTPPGSEVRAYVSHRAIRYSKRAS